MLGSSGHERKGLHVRMGFAVLVHLLVIQPLHKYVWRIGIE